MATHHSTTATPTPLGRIIIGRRGAVTNVVFFRDCSNPSIVSFWAPPVQNKEREERTFHLSGSGPSSVLLLGPPVVVIVVVVIVI